MTLAPQNVLPYKSVFCLTALAKFGFYDVPTLEDGSVIKDNVCFEIVENNSILSVERQIKIYM